jgi:hypothetical protein
MASLKKWLVVYNGQTKSCEDWGIEDLHFEFVSQGTDMCSFVAAAVAFDAPRLFAYGAKVRVIKQLDDEDETQLPWFTGTIIKPRVKGSARAEFQSYSAEGPSFQLRELEFQQPWIYYSNNTKQVAEYTSHIILNGAPNGLTLSTTREQILSVLQYVLDQFGPTEKPFQTGVVTVGPLYPPVDEIRDTPSLEVLRNQMRWHPDGALWLDHSQSPPMLNCKPYAELAPVDLAYGAAVTEGEGYVVEVELDSREDLVRPSVAIKYEVKTTVDGRDQLDVIKDVWPLTATGREMGAATATIDLQGGNATNLKASITSAAIPDDLKSAAALEWWKSKFPETLMDPRVSNIVIVDAGRLIMGDGDDFLPFELLDGQVAEWMPGVAQREELAVQVTFTFYDVDASTSGAQPRAILSDPKILKLSITTTDLESGDYRGPRLLTGGADPIPVALAKALYDSVQVLHWSGTFKLVEDEVTGRVRPGMVVNILGGRPEWAAMRAMVQSVSEGIRDGETLVSVGPPTHLGPQDLTELLRVNRNRSRSGPAGAQLNGELSGGSEGPLGKQTANTDRAPGGELYRLFVCKAGDKTITLDAANGRLTVASGPVGAQIVATLDTVLGQFRLRDEARPNRQITGDLANCHGSDNNDHPVVLKETIVCELVGGQQVPRKAIVWRSDSY